MKNLKNFLKKSWGWFLLIPAGILGLVVLFWKNSKKLFDLVVSVRQSGQQEVDDVKSAREKELEEQRKNREKIDKMLEQLRIRQEKERKEFDENKKKQVAAVVEACGNDPYKLADELSRVTGFKVILPPED